MTTTESGGTWWDWRTYPQTKIKISDELDQPPGKESNQCLHHWRGQLGHSIPPITLRTVLEPNVQIVGGSLKPLQYTRRRYPKGTFTPQRLEPRTGYITLSSLPWRGTQRDNLAFLIILYLPHKFCSNFGIGGVVAGTTPVIISTWRGFIEHTGTRIGGRIPLSLHHSTDELTLHQCCIESFWWKSTALVKLNVTILYFFFFFFFLWFGYELRNMS